MIWGFSTDIHSVWSCANTKWLHFLKIFWGAWPLSPPLATPMATARSNRFSGCEMQSEKELQQKGRGSFEEKGTTIDGVVVRAMKWFDNRPVTLPSTCASIYPLCTVDRWDRSQRQSISVCCPAIVGKYNQNMGGVDALDALVSYYRIGIRSKKKYIYCRMSIQSCYFCVQDEEK